ncbi:MAG: hypothetical protein AB8H79_04145 [Myxococcota bacterium]
MRLSLMTGLALVFGSLAGCGGEVALIVGPPGANTFDELQAQFAGADASKFAFSWSLDGEVVEDLTGMTVPADRTTKGQEWVVTATKGDTIVTAAIEVGNALPTAEVSIEPAGPSAGDDVVAKGIAVDPDGDPAFVEYGWERYNELTADWEGGTFQGRTLPSNATRLGERWRVVVTPQDGDGRGQAGSLEFEIGNGPPEVFNVRVNSTEVTTESVISVTAESSDADGDLVELRYRWLKDTGSGAMLIPDQTSNTLDGAEHFDAGDEIYAEVYGYDGRGEGPAKASPLVRVVNGPPGTPLAVVTPEAPFEDEDLICAVGEPTVDPDGDAVSYRVEWTVNGAPFVAATTTTIPGDTVPASATASQDTWECNLVAFDTAGAARAGVAEVFVDARSGCLDGTTDVDWSPTMEGCLASVDGATTITWREAVDNVATYCASGWEMAGGDIPNGELAGSGYTDSWLFAFNGEGCGGVDHYASTNDSRLSTNSSCLWRKSHFTRLSSESSTVNGVVCVKSPAE